jgi:carbon-monoxide dehydrogenase medium subunit
MKAPAFDYVRPDSLSAALRLLATHHDDARLLAGGQTLLATLNMRLSEPQLLLDLGGLGELRGISLQGQTLRMGALCTHTEIEECETVARHAPLLTQAAPHIAHRAIRNLGTLGGSLAYADPAAEWPACMLALEATMVLASESGERRVAAADFFTDLLTTALQADELLLAVEVPALQADWSWHFDELARRRGDYAIAGLALGVRMQGATVAEARIALLGVGVTPLRASQTEAWLAGRALDAATLEQVRAELARELSGPKEPVPDLTNSAATKRQLACVLLARLLAKAQAVKQRGAQ